MALDQFVSGAGGWQLHHEVLYIYIYIAFEHAYLIYGMKIYVFFPRLPVTRDILSLSFLFTLFIIYGIFICYSVGFAYQSQKITPT